MKPGARAHKRITPATVLAQIITAAAATILVQAAFYIKSSAAPDPAREAVRMTKIPVGNGHTLNLISVDMIDTIEVESVGAAKYQGRANFETLARNANALAAINGCFFDLRSGRIVAHIYHKGRRAVTGSFSAAFAVTNDNRPVIAKIKDLGDPSKYRVIIACVDILMRDGRVLVSDKRDLVRNGHSPSRRNDIYRPARWTAIGIGRSGRVYFVNSPGRMSIYAFTRAVREHTEINDLLGLDGGTSTGLYFDGAVRVRPGRTVPSIIVVRRAAINPLAISKRN